MYMKHTRKTALAVLLFFCTVAMTPVGKRVVFFDDFSGKALDRSKWNVVVSGMHVNDELQGYVDSSATIYLENNALVLKPLYSPGFVTRDGQHFDFVSGRINTRGKFDFKYGTAEARIRLSDGAGLWPAWWLLGDGPWPATGEIDIMECVGDKLWASAAVHGPGYSGAKGPVKKAYFENGNDVTQWHIYAVDWTPDSLTFKYDGRPVFTVAKTFISPLGRWAFDNNKYLILNFAVGGVYPAAVNGIKTPYYGLSPAALDLIKEGKAKMWVDWVKVSKG